MRVNVGCGLTPTEGWRNFDNSPTVRLARLPGLSALRALRLLDPERYRFACFARDHGIEFADATERIPLPDASCDALYSSHMLEHLDRLEAERFLHEAHRVLAPGGVIRIAVPDLTKLVQEYEATGDADRFIERTLLSVPRPKSAAARLRLLLAGVRHHLWMYDGTSLCRLLERAGFVGPEVTPPGTTRIVHPEPLDLSERVDESVYVEAERPK